MVLRLAALIVLLPCLAAAGSIHPELRAKMENADGPVLLQVVARLHDRVDTRAIDQDLKQRKATLAERHALVISSLQEKASSTQGPLLEYLAARESEGVVTQVQSYWIDNLVGFKATVVALEAIAEREDVEVIFAEPEVFFDEPLDVQYATERVNASEPGLRAINAHRLWRIGIAGQGRIVSNIDTGVNGNHVALSTRWRGTLPGVQPQHAWYSGTGSTFPVDSDNPGHGTHTMGTMTGLNAAASDTLGVAPAAYWIAGTSPYTGAFQWAADPDNNPFTISDVPDVVNCSWFTSGDLCTGGSTYWSLMDNVELAGGVVIWSAGNCGPGGSSGSCTGGATPGAYRTITPPKNRVFSDVNAFAVGALDGNSASLTIASFSSRGPSACDTSIIKPEVSAPGVNVRSTYASGGYGSLSGTSMAAPHVAGAVALLRQVNPNADADEIKYALLNTARDLGPAGEDNAYGMGIIDVFAAAEAITPYRVQGIITDASSSQPVRNARVEVIQTEQISSTDSTGSYSIRSLKSSVSVKVSAFTYRDTTITVVLQPDVPLQVNAALSLLPFATVSGTITDSASTTGVAVRLNFHDQADPSGGPTFTTTSQGNGSYNSSIRVGTYRVEIIPPAPYPDKITVNNVVVPGSGATLSVVLAPAHILIIDDDAGGRYDTLYQNSVDRLGLRRRTFGVADSAGALGSVLASFQSRPVLLWFTGNDSTNALTPAERQTIMSHLAGGGRLILTGQNIAEFSAPGDSLMRHFLGVQYGGLAPAVFLRGFAGDIIGNGISYLVTGGAGNQSSKDFVSIVGSSFGATTKTMYYVDTTEIAAVRVLGQSPVWGATYFGFGIEGLSPARQDTLILRSLRYFDQIVVSVGENDEPGLPQSFVLEQNYPNPFNPTTQIRYGLPSESIVRLSVYNLVGQEVARLVDGREPAGYHTVVWNGTSSSGSPVSSGMYMYRLDAVPSDGVVGAPSAQIRKMLFIK